jgi:hypothetical protein
VSLAAGAPSLPKTAVFAKVDTAAATGLMVLLQRAAKEANQIAEEAYILAFSMLVNYKTMYVFSVNKNLPTF